MRLIYFLKNNFYIVLLMHRPWKNQNFFINNFVNIINPFSIALNLSATNIITILGLNWKTFKENSINLLIAGIF